MQIGLISDTHGSLPAQVFEIFQTAAHIIHAGDIGNANIISELETIAPVTSVYGNIDTFPLVLQIPAKTNLILDGLKIHIVHDIGTISQYTYVMFKEKIIADIVIYGHTHRAGCDLFKDTLFCNPGSATSPRFGKKPSVALLDTEKPGYSPEIIYFS